MAGSAIKVTNVDGTAINTIAPTYTEADIDATITGPVIMWEDASDTIRAVSAVNPLPIMAGTRVAIAAAYTRLANTTAYTAADSVSNNTTGEVPLTFTGCSRAGFGGKITGAVLVDDSVPGTGGDFTLYLFDATVTATDDNVALSISDADALLMVGLIKFTVENKTAVNTVYSADLAGLPISFVSATGNLFGLVSVENSYTPASGGVLTWRLLIERD